jgi:hypothetical protein
MNRYNFDSENHIHLLDSRPLFGTTTVGKVLSKGGLTYWASGCAVKSLGWVDPKIKKYGKQIGTVPIAERVATAEIALGELKSLTPREYLNRLDLAYKAHSVKLNDSAEAGTDAHYEAEKWILSYMDGKDYEPEFEPVAKFAEWARKNVKRFILSEGHTYSERLWVGGIIDCLYEDLEGKICLLDFKSSSGIYISQKVQTSGYSIQLEESGAFTPDGTQILEPTKVDYYAIWSFGMDIVEPVREFRMSKLREAFEHEVCLYKITEIEFKD